MTERSIESLIILVFGIWLWVIIWDLEFGHWNLI